MSKFKNPFRFTSIFKPMVYLFLFSLVYGFGTIRMIELDLPFNDLLRSVWLAFFGLGFYFICTLIWGKKRKTLALAKSGEVFGLCLLLALLTAYVISPLSFGTNDPFRLIAGALLGSVFLLFALPTLILIFRAVYEDRMSARAQYSFVCKVWKEKFWYILNLWLLLFILMFAWDNFLGGPLYTHSGFGAPGLFATVLFLKEPTVYFEMIWMLASNASGVYELIMLGLMEAILEIFLECNIISWIGHAAASVMAGQDPGSAALESPGKRSSLSKPSQPALDEPARPRHHSSKKSGR